MDGGSLYLGDDGLDPHLMAAADRSGWNSVRFRIVMDTQNAGLANSERRNSQVEPDVLRAALRLALSACRQLSDELGAPVSELELIDVEPHTWPDSSLGLARPGAVYAPAVTDGLILRFRWSSAEYTFHTSWQGPPVCMALESAPAWNEDHPLVADAMLRLAESLGERFSAITFVGAAGGRALDASAEREGAADNEDAEQFVTVDLRCGGLAFRFTGPAEGPLRRVSSD